MIDLSNVVGFDWDDGNSRKSLDKHVVSQTEAEQVFANDPLIVVDDAKHSDQELRFNALGRTNGGRRLHISFTLRQNDQLVRVISARDMNRKERTIYAQA